MIWSILSYSLHIDSKRNTSEKNFQIDKKTLELKPKPNLLVFEAQPKIGLERIDNKIETNKKINSRLIDNESIFTNQFRKYELYALGSNETKTQNIFQSKISTVNQTRIPELSLKLSEEFADIGNIPDPTHLKNNRINFINNKGIKRLNIKKYLDPIIQRNEDSKENEDPSLSLNLKRKLKVFDNYKELGKKRRPHRKGLAPIHHKINTISPKNRNRKNKNNIECPNDQNSDNPYSIKLKAYFGPECNKITKERKKINKTSIRKRRNSKNKSNFSYPYEIKNAEEKVKNFDNTLDHNYSQNYKLVLRQPFEYPYINSNLKIVQKENQSIAKNEFSLNLEDENKLENSIIQKEDNLQKVPNRLKNRFQEIFYAYKIKEYSWLEIKI